jgi:uncharacterized protein (UPF0210 family)
MMMMQLTEDQRNKIALLARCILPGAHGQPSAEDVDLEFAGIDRALKSRPELGGSFCTILDRFDDDAEDFLTHLSETDFNLLMTLICAAYLMDSSVKKALGYNGQEALTPNRGGFGAEELVLEMMQQPKRYRDI